MWFVLGPVVSPRGKEQQSLDVSEAWVQVQLKDAKWAAETRRRLNCLDWFMKCLKEPLARMSNKEDKCKGTFFEGRFKSIAILDEEALLTTLAYVDLNLVAVGVAQTTEESEYTSVKARVDHCREQGTLREVIDQPNDGTKHGTPLEDELFCLVPIGDRRERGGTRAGISPQTNLASYLQLLDWSSRLLRVGQTRVPKEVAEILSRLGSSTELWQYRSLRSCVIELTST